MSHTPTPWKCREENIVRIASPDDRTICACEYYPSRDQCEVDAAHIVLCVNAHDKLVAAVKKYREICDYVCQGHPDDCNCSKCDELAEVDEALKAAGVVG